MTAMIKPAMVLQMDLDSRVYNEELVAELKRSYAYIAAPLVICHEVASEAEANNIVRIVVKIRKPYWHVQDEVSNELWNNTMLPWFSNVFAKLSVALPAFNNNRAKRDEAPFIFNWLELELEDERVRMPLASDCSLPADALDRLAQARIAAAQEAVCKQAS